MKSQPTAGLAQAEANGEAARVSPGDRLTNDIELLVATGGMAQRPWRLVEPQKAVQLAAI